LEIYTNLSSLDSFCKAVVKDERSFKIEYLHKASRVLKKRLGTYSNQDLENFVIKLGGFKTENEEIDNLEDGAPEEFICPISCELMRDPVLLPTCGKVCDRSSMQRILLNDEHDPFNRAPLKMSDLQEELSIKYRIEVWIRQKKAGEVTDEEKN